MAGNAQQQSRLKELIARGKEQGYLTYAEINDHLPESFPPADLILSFAELPGVAESIDWLSALSVLGEPALNEDIVRRTLGVLLKYQDDIEKTDGPELRRLLEAAA